MRIVFIVPAHIVKFYFKPKLCIPFRDCFHFDIEWKDDDEEKPQTNNSQSHKKEVFGVYVFSFISYLLIWIQIVFLSYLDLCIYKFPIQNSKVVLVVAVFLFHFNPRVIQKLETISLWRTKLCFLLAHSFGRNKMHNIKSPLRSFCAINKSHILIYLLSSINFIGIEVNKKKNVYELKMNVNALWMKMNERTNVHRTQYKLNWVIFWGFLFAMKNIPKCSWTVNTIYTYIY